mgnify:FL=1
MFACPVKANLGFECPGCGMQRSIVALSEGQLIDSFTFYPALIPIICMLLFLMVHLKFKFKHGARVLLIFYILNSAIILGNFLIKLL